MFLFAWRRTESAGSSTSGGKEPFPGLGGHGQTELQPGDIDASPAKPTRCKLTPAELEMAEISVRGMADIPLVDVQADPADATAVSSGHVTALASSLGGHGQTELQPGDIESPPAKPTLAELDIAEIPVREVGRAHRPTFNSRTTTIGRARAWIAYLPGTRPSVSVVRSPALSVR
jgi:hypothetical protein